MFASIAAPAKRLVVLRSFFFIDGQAADWSLQLHRTYRSYGCYSQTSAHRSSRGSSQPSLQCKCMYIETFIPYHMYMYVREYINSLWCSHPLSCRSSNYISQPFFNGQAVVDACSYAALTSLSADIRSRCRGCPAAVFHSYPGTEWSSCMYVCMYVRTVCM